MSEIIPIFPLNLVVFPNETLNLHVFEPRYKELVTECIKSGKNFGIPAYINEELMQYGTEVDLYKIDRIYTDGEMDICTRGERVFRIVELYKQYEDKQYAFAKVEWVENIDNSETELKQQAITLIADLYKALKVEKEIPNLDNFKVYNVAHLVGFNVNQEYDLLQLTQELDRQKMLIKHLNNILPFAKETDNLKERIQMNGHFKNISPPDF